MEGASRVSDDHRRRDSVFGERGVDPFHHDTRVGTRPAGFTMPWQVDRQAPIPVLQPINDRCPRLFGEGHSMDEHNGGKVASGIERGERCNSHNKRFLTESHVSSDNEKRNRVPTQS